MMGAIHKLLQRVSHDVALFTGSARRRFHARKGTIQLLTYHGVIPDALADRPWVPSHLHTVSQFESHMRTVAQLGESLTLGDALKRLDADPEAPPAVCITFDDGTADNASLVLPILQQFNLRATFFLATGYVDLPGLLPNDMLRLLGWLDRQGKLQCEASDNLRALLRTPAKAKQLPRDNYIDELNALWAAHQLAVDVDATEHLHMMSWDQVYRLREAGMEIGAHTAHHVLLGPEDADTRRDEIKLSVNRVREMLGVKEVGFSYPNGMPGDYNADDIEVLKALPVPYAVTQNPGWLTRGTPRFELPRQSISRHCSTRTLMAHAYGLRVG